MGVSVSLPSIESIEDTEESHLSALKAIAVALQKVVDVEEDPNWTPPPGRSVLPIPLPDPASIKPTLRARSDVIKIMIINVKYLADTTGPSISSSTTQQTSDSLQEK